VRGHLEKAKRSQVVCGSSLGPGRGTYINLKMKLVSLILLSRRHQTQGTVISTSAGHSAGPKLSECRARSSCLLEIPNNHNLNCTIASSVPVSLSSLRARKSLELVLNSREDNV